MSELPCPARRPSTESTEARTYLIGTASPGYTMTRQGPELAIERLHPDFAVRLANALREARDVGLPFAGIFSAYRPPAFGVGGFADKFNSLHAYGLAVDIHGIGRPGSDEARRWHEIAGRHGVVCPYGPRNRAEWNHCQPTRLKIVVAENPLRETITAQGPLSLETMFEVGSAVIDSAASAADAVVDDMSETASAQEIEKRVVPRLVHLKLKRAATDQESVSAQEAKGRSDAKPSGISARRAARIAAKGKSEAKSRPNRHFAGGRLAKKKAARLAAMKVRAGLKLTKPRAIIVEEGRRTSKSKRS